MNHGGLGVLDGTTLKVPLEILEHAFVRRDSVMYGVYYVPPKRRGFRDASDKHDFMLTPIPYRFWPRTARLSLRLRHEPQTTRVVSEYLAKHNVSIIQAESCRSAYRYGTWSFYVVFEDLPDLTFDPQKTVYKETLARLEQLTTGLRRDCGKALFSDGTDIDYLDSVSATYNTALAYFHNYSETRRRQNSRLGWLHRPFRMLCKEPGVLSAPEGDPELPGVVEHLRLSGSAGRCVSFTSLDTRHLNLRNALIPERDLKRFAEVIVEYQRAGSPDSCLGVVAGVTKALGRDVNIWNFHSRTFVSEPTYETGRLTFILQLSDNQESPEALVHSRLAGARLPKSLSIRVVQVGGVSVSVVDRRFQQQVDERGRYDVFVSHNTKDADAAETLKSEMESVGLRAYLYQRDVTPGDLFDERILQGIRQSREFCVLYSRHSRDSEYVTTEWGAAWALGKRITPIVKGVDFNELPPRLRRISAVTWDNRSNYCRELESRLASSRLW